MSGAMRRVPTERRSESQKGAVKTAAGTEAARVRAADGWLATLVLGAVNASHLWFFAGVFTMFPAALKRLAVVGVGTAYPVAATMVAASTGDSVAEDKWLTYWSCFSLVP